MGVWARALDLYGVNDAKAYGRTAWLLTLGTLIMGTSRGAVAPYLVLFLVAERGIPLSVIGIGMRSHAGVAAMMFKALSSKGINILAITTSEIKISVLIDAAYAELAVRTLHSIYGLDAD